MNWLDKLLPPQIKQTDPKRRKSIPEGLWFKCPECEAVLYRTDVEANLFVCPKCDHHMPIGARERLDHLLDVEGRYEIGRELLPVDPAKQTRWW
jgi:acetyl-CoA carboxylase carboxyl transferase subunit beta